MYRSQCDGIIAECTATIEIEPDNPKPLFKRGCAYYIDKEEYEKAIADFTAAYKIEQKAEYLYHRGYAYYRKKEYDKAIADYTAEIKIKQKEKELHKRGFIYLDDTDYRMELGEYLYYRGCAYHCKDDYENAIVDYTIQKNLKWWGLGSVALRWRGCAYACNKKYGEAFYDFQEAVEGAFEDEPLLFEEALMQKVWELFNYEYPDASYGDFPLDAPDSNRIQAIADYTAALEIKPNDTEYMHYLNKEYDKAIAYYTAEIEAPTHIFSYTYYARSRAYECNKEYDKALADMRKVLKLDKNGDSNHYEDMQRLLKFCDS